MFCEKELSRSLVVIVVVMYEVNVQETCKQLGQSDAGAGVLSVRRSVATVL